MVWMRWLRILDQDIYITYFLETVLFYPVELTLSEWNSLMGVP